MTPSPIAPRRRLRNRLMLAFAGFTLLVAALFALAASSLARWWLKAGRFRCPATTSSLCLESWGSRFWARIRLSREVLSKGRPIFRQPAAIKPMSNSALWAARGRPAAKSRKALMASS